jgi:hypothetical protein
MVLGVGTSRANADGASATGSITVALTTAADSCVHRPP